MTLQLAVKVRADSSVPSDLAPSSAALDQFGARAKASAAGSSQWATEAQRSANAAQALRQSHEGVAASMATGARAAVLFAASLAAGKLLEYADTWTRIGDRLRLATQDTSQMKAVQEQLFQAAQKAGVGMTSVVDVYSRASRSARELGASQEQLTRFSGGVAQAVALGGASAEAAAGALQQLGQALGSGTVHAEEFNSVLDGAPRIAQAVAAGLTATGGSVARLKEMINDGKVSSKEFFDAFLSQIPRIESEFGTATPTMARAMTTLQNAMTKLVGESNNALGVTTTLAHAIQALGENLDGAAGVAGQMALGLAAIGAARVVPTGIQALTTAIDDQRVALYAKAVATVEAANAEKLAAAQSLITAQRAQAATAATLAGAEAEFAAKAAAASSAAAGVTAAEVALTQARAKTSLTTNVYVANKALAAEREAQAAATAAREASIAADAQKVASLTRLRAVQAEAAVAGGAVAAANTHLTIAAEGASAASGALAQRASLLSAAWGGVKSAGTALWGMLGGPWGFAFLSAAAVTYLLATRTSAAERAQEAYNKALSDGRKRVDEITNASRERANQLQEEQRNDAAAAQSRADATRGKIETLQALIADLRSNADAGGTAGLFSGLFGDGGTAGIKRLEGELAVARKEIAATAAVLDSMAAVGQKTGDAVGLELASKLARGTGAFSALDKATSDVMKSLGLTIQSGRLMSNEQADVEKSTQVLNRALAAGPGFLRSWGSSAAQINLVLDTMRQKIDPVASAVADLNREIAQMQVPDGAARAALTTLQQINQERAKAGQQPLTTVSPEYLTLLDKAKELETQRAQAQANARAKLIPLEEKIARAQAAGNDVLVAKLTREKAITEMEAKGVETAVAAGLAQQDFDVSVTAAGAAAGEAGKGFLQAADGQMRLAQAAGLGEAAARQAAYANKLAEEAAKGNGNVAAQAAANQREEAAAILTLRNETVRGLALETANTNALTTAMAAGGEAVRVAQENEYKLGLIRKLGTDATVDGTAAQRALNDAMDAYRANRAANDNNKLEQERRAANDNLALAQRELALMGEAEGVRSRALETMRNQQEAARKVAELGEEGAKQWLAWQEQIADTRALVDFQKEVKQTSKGIADDLAAKMFDKGGSILDWWRNLLKRMAIEIASTQFIMPIVQQVVGAVPQLFGIHQAPASVGGQAATGGLTNAALSKAGGWALDKLVPGGLMGSLDAWGYSTLGIGSASYGAPLVGANGMLTGGGATSLAAPTGLTGGLSGYLGAAGAGAFGGLLGGLLGTATNSKVVGGLSGAALGAGGSALASAMGLGVVGGPIGIAIGAIVGGVMGALGTQKASVGPNAAGNLYVDGKGAKSGPSAGDNGMDGSAMTSLTDALAQSVNTIVSGIGATFKSSLSEMNFGHVTYFDQTKTWSYTPFAGADPAGGKRDFVSQEEMVSAIIRDTLKRLDSGGQVTGVTSDVRTALANSKATKAEDLAKDLDFATGFRAQIDALSASLDPTNNQIKTLTEAAGKLGEQVKTNLLDWSAKAKDLGLATDAELTPALRAGMLAMMGLGPAVQPLRGLDAVAKRAEINLATLRPALEGIGYSAAEQADIADRYAAKMRADYLSQVALIQSQGDAVIAALIDPTTRLSAATRMRGAGFDMDAPGLTGLAGRIDAVELSARAGALTVGDLRGALALIDDQLRAGALTADQYNSAVQSLSQSWQQSVAVADALRQGQSAVDLAINPARKAGASSILADAGIAATSPGVSAFAAQMDGFLKTARAGTAATTDLTNSHAALQRLLTSGAITTQQYQTVLSSLTSAYTDAASAAAGNADAMRRGNASVAALLDPSRKPDAASILADAGIGATAAGVSAFAAQMDSFLKATRAGTAANADLTNSHAALQRLLTTGAISADQYQTVLSSLTAAYSDAATAAATAATTAAASADAIRRGNASVAALLDPARKPDAASILADTGISATAAGVSAFAAQMDGFLKTARAGTAATTDLTNSHAALQRLLTTGAISADQYQTVLSSLTSAYGDAATAATTNAEALRDRANRVWTDTATKAVQQIGDDWRKTADAARQAAADWSGVSSAMGKALDSLLVNKDLSNLGADAMLAETKRQFDAAAQKVLDYQGLRQLGREPSEEARKAAVDAAGQLDALGQRYLEEARAYGLGAEEYQRRLEQVQGLWASTRDMARSLSTAETSRAQGLDRQIDWLSRVNDSITGTASTNAALLEDIRSAILAGRTPVQTPASTAAAWVSDWFGRYNTLLADQQAGRLTSDQVNAAGVSLYQEKLARVDALPGETSVWRAVIDAARTSPNGGPTADWLTQLAHDRRIPQFERGGQHSGGARIVGERGIELEVTGPARYWTHNETRDILSPKSVSVTVDMAPVVVAIGGVTSAVMDIGRLIQDLALRVANVEDAITDLSRSHGQLATQLRKMVR